MSAVESISDTASDLLVVIKKNKRYKKIQFNDINKYKQWILSNVVPLLNSLNHNKIISTIIVSNISRFATIDQKNIDLLRVHL